MAGIGTGTRTGTVPLLPPLEAGLVPLLVGSGCTQRGTELVVPREAVATSL